MSHEVERQYYKLGGALHDEAEAWRLSVWEKYKTDLKAFIEEIGTNDFLMQGAAIVGFRKTEQSAKIEGTRNSKDYPGYLVPHRKTKAGRALVERLSGYTRPRPIELLNRIAPGQPWFVGTLMIWASFAYSDRTGAHFISVPVEASFKPLPEFAADMTPIKRWEFLREFDPDEVQAIADPV